MFTDAEGNQSREYSLFSPPKSYLLMVSGWTSFRVFLRVSWEPFEARFDSINSSFREHVEIVIRTANVVELERVHSKEALKALRNEGTVL